jgi:thioredoxin-like negative regulator of GroEL
VFAKVNTEDEKGIAAEFGIRSIPTLMLFRDQIILYSEAGALPPMQLEQLIEQARALDMDKVRAEMAESPPDA